MKVVMSNLHIYRKLMITWKSGKILIKDINPPHTLWVNIFKISRGNWKEALKLQKNRVGILNFKMGGDLRREEPDNISRWKEMSKVWTKLEKGFMTNFMERLVDYDKGRVNLAINKITKNWINESFKIHVVRFKLDADLIAIVTGMPHLGLNFFRDFKVSNNVVMLFPRKEKEREKIGKDIGGYYDASNIKKIWGCVLNAIMEYITVEGHFTRAHTYHFVLLNHSRHDKRIYLPYCLSRSLSRYLNKHSKNPSNPKLHCGLILLIYEHCKILAIQENKRLSASPGKGKRKVEEGGPSKEEPTQSKNNKSASGMKIQETRMIRRIPEKMVVRWKWMSLEGRKVGKKRMWGKRKEK